MFVPIDSVSEKGDVNADGAFNVADVVALQKWLLTVPDTHLANWEAADMWSNINKVYRKKLRTR